MLDRKTLHAIVAKHFRVYEERSELLQGQAVADLFFVMFKPEEFDARFEAARAELLAADSDLLVFVRQEGGEDVIVVAKRPPVPPRKLRTNVILFMLTLATTAMGGAMFWAGFRDPTNLPSFWGVFTVENLLWGGLTFALPLMLILGIHESAHFIAAKRHGLRATLPYFIPFPPALMPIGTLGAFISLKDPLPDRKALFDVGASGPLAGFIVAVPVLLVGIMLTNAAAIEVPDQGRPEIDAPGAVLDVSASGETTLRYADLQGAIAFDVRSTESDWAFTATATVEDAEGVVRSESKSAVLGEGEARRLVFMIPDDAVKASIKVEWSDGLLTFGDPLLVKGLQWTGLVEDKTFMSHPTWVAGWVGLLVTGINLLPAGQLDGGHVSRALLGENHRFAAIGAVGLLFFVGFQFQAWILMALFVVLMGIHHPPPLNDRTELDAKRKALGVVVLLVFVLTFVANPIQF